MYHYVCSNEETFQDFIEILKNFYKIHTWGAYIWGAFKAHGKTNNKLQENINPNI